jgi:hypothetical protein
MSYHGFLLVNDMSKVQKCVLGKTSDY